MNKDPVENQLAVLCSFGECTNGHKWRMQLQVAKCSGCQSDIFARRLVNCPICNEPPETMEIRIDHLAQGMAIMPLCKGAERNAQVDVVVLKRELSKEEQEMLRPE